MVLPWKAGSYSPTKIQADKFATETEVELRKKRKTNKKWILYLVVISILTLALIALIVLLSMKVEGAKPRVDECGLVYSEENLRIIDGVEAVKHSWPAQAVVIFRYFVANYSLALPNSTEQMVALNKPTGSLCGGTLINRWTIMTAAHCIIGSFNVDLNETTFQVKVEPNEFYPTYESMFTVYLGAHSLNDLHDPAKKNTIQKHTIKRIIKHRGYNHSTITNDISLLILERPAELNKKVQIACLPSVTTDSYPLPGTAAYAVGWGMTSTLRQDSADKLQNTIITILNDTICQMRDYYYITAKLCATDLTGYGKGVCHGDSGGSLYVKDKKDGKQKFISIGIVSYGHRCGSTRNPGYFTRVSHYVPWIEENLKNINLDSI